jgi:Ceramidase
MSYTQPNYHFCEVFLYQDTQEPILPVQPEYVNSFTSLIIFFLGLLLLQKSSKQPTIFQLCATCFMCNGIASFGYHWTLMSILGSLDTASMIFASYFGASYLFEITRNINHPYFKWITIVENFVLMCGLLLTIGFAEQTTGIPEFEFQYWFMLAQGFVCSGLARWVYYVPRIRKAIALGFSIVVSSGILWLITEPSCHNNHWIAYTFSHAFFHIGMSSGFYIMLKQAIKEDRDEIELPQTVVN